LAKFYQIFPVFPMDNIVVHMQQGILEVGDEIFPKTNFAVSSMEYCCCLFDEGDIIIGNIDAACRY
jgi:hypothetical protein